MADVQRVRRVSELIDDFDALRARCETLGDHLTGLALLFGAAAALVLAIGLVRGAPMFALGAGFALAAAVAFGATAQVAARASRAAPRVQPA